MPDQRSLRQGLLVAASRIGQHLPGAPGGLGTFFAARGRLDDGLGDRWREDMLILLAHSERALAAGRIDRALSWFDKAMRIAYHGCVHNLGGSPLAADPASFLAPLRFSSVGQVLIDGELPAETGPGPAPQRPRAARHRVRILVVAQSNWTFIRPILDALRSTGRFEIRELEVDDLPAPDRPERARLLRARYDAVTTGARIPTPAPVLAGYDWADVVLVEWGHHILTWVTLLDRAPRCLVARFHRFEAFTPFPLLMDPARIDRAVYVAPAVQRLLEVLVPALAATASQVSANLLPRGLGELPEHPRDRHLLTQIGWVREIKDVLFSLEVLERLRADDRRFRLQLIGPGLPGDETQDTAYQHRVRRRIEQLGPEAVQVLGVRQDVPELLGTSGFVISSSYQEGTHESVMEGLAAGCVAVVRDWPDLSAYGGAAGVYDREAVVEDVDQAVQRIRRLQDPAVFDRASRSAREFAIAQRDPAVIRAEYEEALRPCDER